MYSLTCLFIDSGVQMADTTVCSTQSLVKIQVHQQFYPDEGPGPPNRIGAGCEIRPKPVSFFFWGGGEVRGYEIEENAPASRL